MYTVLVIDMQRGFLNRFSNKRNLQTLIANCRRVVVKAIADGAEIIDVNYRDPDKGFGLPYGPTIPEIKNLWKHYQKLFKNNVKRVIKHEDNGGFPIMEAQPQHKTLYACGINLGACVGATVDELIEDFDQDVLIIEEAVANCWGGHDEDLQRYEKQGILVNMG